MIKSYIYKGGNPLITLKYRTVMTSDNRKQKMEVTDSLIDILLFNAIWAVFQQLDSWGEQV